jgi:hypothetical protein
MVSHYSSIFFQTIGCLLPSSMVAGSNSYSAAGDVHHLRRAQMVPVPFITRSGDYLLKSLKFEKKYSLPPAKGVMPAS